MMEQAFTHGYLSARVDGYAEKRARARRRRLPSDTGQPNLAGWAQLAAFAEQHAPNALRRGGERLVH